MSLNQVSIGVRIAALSGVLLLIAALLGALGWASVREGRNSVDAAHAMAQVHQGAIGQARNAQVTFKVQIQEWKNLLLRSHQPGDHDKYRAAFVREGAQVQRRLDELLVSYGRMGLDAQPVKEVQQQLAQLQREYLAALGRFDLSDPAGSALAMDKAVKGKDRAPTAQLDKLVATVVAQSERRQSEAQAEMQATTTRLLTLIGGLVALGMLVGAGVSWCILRSITRPLQDVVAAAADVAAGRLDRQLHVHGRDEVSQLLQAVVRMNDSLRGVVVQVRDSAEHVAHASGEIAVGNMDLSTRTESQAACLQETAATIEELSTGVQVAASHAEQAQRLVTQATDVAERGGSVVGQVVDTMGEIHASSRKISDIIAVIDSIAFQTNILALNAAVESARAGEHGRGFAVVAGEVRALAQRSASAAREIATLIQGSVQSVEKGSGLVQTAGQTIRDTMDAVRCVQQAVSQIVVAAREQAAGIGQISQTVGAMDITMQQNAALVEQAAAAAAALKQQSDALRGSVGFFHV